MLALLYNAKPFGSGNRELLNLKNDPGESNDLSQQFPAKRDSLMGNWMQYANDNNVVDHKGYYDSLLLKSLNEEQ